MTSSIKIIKASAKTSALAAKPAKTAKPSKADKKPKTSAIHAGDVKTVATAVKADAVTKYADLNKAFLANYAGGRAIFGEKRPTPVDYTKHKPSMATMRDMAFIKALRSVYGSLPFTSADIRCDTGNIARAVNLKLLQSLGSIDGIETFKLVPNTVSATPANA